MYCYVHYKTYTKPEIKKRWDKDEMNIILNMYFIVFINGAKKNFLPEVLLIVLRNPLGNVHSALENTDSDIIKELQLHRWLVCSIITICPF